MAWGEVSTRLKMSLTWVKFGHIRFGLRTKGILEAVFMPLISGAGGLILNAKDIVIWLQTLLSEGQNPMDGETVIPDKVIRRVASGVTGNSLNCHPSCMEEARCAAPIAVLGSTLKLLAFLIKPWGFRSCSRELRYLTVLSNDETFGIHIAEAVKYRIIDEVLNLGPIDWSASIAAHFNDRPIPTSRSPSPTLPSIPFSALAGTYRDPGYGVLDLCFVSPKSLVTSASESCPQLIDEIPIVTTLPAVLGPRIPTLLARWNRFEVTHAAFAHFEQNLFSVTAVSVVHFQLLFLSKHLMGSHQSTGNSSVKPYWVQIETDPSFDLAEFSFEDKVGVGLQGLGGAGRGFGGPQGNSARDRAEVWFEKIDKVLFRFKLGLTALRNLLVESHLCIFTLCIYQCCRDASGLC
ncbi:hypothetical protein DFH08DRAFT_1014805 [Mycena albidolilacea]|uniref:Uncharacterized protein n=1 Tax=Mycena albidolilacea TaxID=1033008 RepID=A0AAD6ZTA2_9AGAR|nr:hypothetical protein DFH08DRAFT_1014805 [Mycena albidolilacea]